MQHRKSGAYRRAGGSKAIFINSRLRSFHNFWVRSESQIIIGTHDDVIVSSVLAFACEIYPHSLGWLSHRPVKKFWRVLPFILKNRKLFALCKDVDIVVLIFLKDRE